MAFKRTFNKFTLRLKNYIFIVMKIQLKHIAPSYRWLACGDTMIVSRELSPVNPEYITFNQGNKYRV